MGDTHRVAVDHNRRRIRELFSSLRDSNMDGPTPQQASAVTPIVCGLLGVSIRCGSGLRDTFSVGCQAFLCPRNHHPSYRDTLWKVRGCATAENPRFWCRCEGAPNPHRLPAVVAAATDLRIGGLSDVSQACEDSNPLTTSTDGRSVGQPFPTARGESQRPLLSAALAKEYRGLGRQDNSLRPTSPSRRVNLDPKVLIRRSSLNRRQWGLQAPLGCVVSYGGDDGVETRDWTDERANSTTPCSPSHLLTTSYGHRTMNTRLPVRSALVKHGIARLVLQWVTMRESLVP